MSVGMDFFEAVKAHLKANNVLYAPLRFDLLDTKESIAFAFSPTAPAERTYGGYETRNLQFQLLTKSTDQQKAYGALERMFDLLRLGNKGLSAMSFTLIKCEPYGTVQFVEKTDKAEFIYTALFTAELHEMEVSQ